MKKGRVTPKDSVYVGRNGGPQNAREGRHGPRLNDCTLDTRGKTGPRRGEETPVWEVKLREVGGGGGGVLPRLVLSLTVILIFKGGRSASGIMK